MEDSTMFSRILTENVHSRAAQGQHRKLQQCPKSYGNNHEQRFWWEGEIKLTVQWLQNPLRACTPHSSLNFSFPSKHLLMIVFIAFEALLELSILPLGSSWMHILSESDWEYCGIPTRILWKLLQCSQEFSLRTCIQELPKGNVGSSNNVLKAIKTIMGKGFDGKEKSRWLCNY